MFWFLEERREDSRADELLCEIRELPAAWPGHRRRLAVRGVGASPFAAAEQSAMLDDRAREWRAGPGAADEELQQRAEPRPGASNPP